MTKALPFGRYLLLDPIKGGGMSEIWRARPKGEASVVAVKRVLPAFAEDPEMLALFLDEARVSVQLTHANIARVFDLGRVRDELYIAMEYVPGVDLRSVFKREAAFGRHLPVPLAVLVMAQICDALDYAHRRVGARGTPLRIVHRDVAPDNCLVTFDGAVKLIDFGVAKAASQSQKTEAGALKGKLSYMSPEQVLGKELDRRSDVFSVGAVLWEMVTGERLFWRENQLEILRQVRMAKVVPPRQLSPEVSPELERIILKALSRDREQRFAWASELAAALRRCLERMKSPPTAAHLRKYLAMTFPDELEAERVRRVEWARYERETRAPTVAEMKAVKLPPLKTRRPPAPAVEVADLGEEELDGEDRPTLLQESVRPGLELPEELLDPAAELPPPIPSPHQPTQALQAFAEEAGDLDADAPPTLALQAFVEEESVEPEDSEAPTKPIDETVPVRAVRMRRPAPLEGTAPPAMMPRKPPRR